VRPLSQRAIELLAELHRQPTLADQLFGRTTETATTLKSLGECGEPALVPYLLNFVFSNSRELAVAAADALGRCVEAASPDELLELDRSCRESWSGYLWDGLKPVQVARLDALGDREVMVVGVASFHANGYVREAAVTRLTTFHGGRELPFLLVRLNDWVNRVADCAAQAVEQRLVPAYALGFVDNLSMLLRLEISGRREHQRVLDRIYALLKDSGQRDVLAHGLRSVDRRIRRRVYRLAREAPGADQSGLLRQALQDADTLIRLEAVTDARARMSVDELRSVLQAIMSDPYPLVRREGITAAAERLAAETGERLTAALVDPSKSVREAARYYLHRGAHEIDVARYYRQQLAGAASPRHLANAIAGLGETGSSSDAALVVPYLEHGQAAVRRASVRALVSLDPAEHEPRLLHMLHDPVPSVSHTVRRVLRPRAGRIGRSALASVLQTASYPHSRFDALALATSLGKWDSLIMLLAAATDADDGIRNAVTRWLNDWIAKQNRSFAEPSRAQIETIRSALDTCRFAVGPAVVGELRSILRQWE
jgi:HEAT repeat protein